MSSTGIVTDLVQLDWITKLLGLQQKPPVVIRDCQQTLLQSGDTENEAT